MIKHGKEEKLLDRNEKEVHRVWHKGKIQELKTKLGSPLVRSTGASPAPLKISAILDSFFVLE